MARLRIVPVAVYLSYLFPLPLPLPIPLPLLTAWRIGLTGWLMAVRQPVAQGPACPVSTTHPRLSATRRARARAAGSTATALCARPG